MALLEITWDCDLVEVTKQVSKVVLGEHTVEKALEALDLDPKDAEVVLLRLHTRSGVFDPTKMLIPVGWHPVMQLEAAQMACEAEQARKDRYRR